MFVFWLITCLFFLRRKLYSRQIKIITLSVFFSYLSFNYNMFSIFLLLLERELNLRSLIMLCHIVLYTQFHCLSSLAMIKLTFSSVPSEYNRSWKAIKKQYFITYRKIRSSPIKLSIRAINSKNGRLNDLSAFFKGTQTDIE